MRTFENTKNPMINYFVRRDLLDDSVEPIHVLWNLPPAKKILDDQLPSGAWPDKNTEKHKNSPTNYQLLETYRNLGKLIQIYGFNKNHPSINKAIEFIFTTQAEEGDFRGIYGTQYSPNYTAGLLELILKAGYTESPKIEKVLQYFFDNIQEDGGWIVPMQGVGIKSYESKEIFSQQHLITANKALPSAHFVTGIVIRAFAHHPKYNKSEIAYKAAKLLSTRFFKPDKYSARQGANFWTKYTFPFWWTDLISVLDSFAFMDFPRNNSGVKHALNYYHQHQLPDSSWDFYILKNKSEPDLKAWLTFILCRIFKHYFA